MLKRSFILSAFLLTPCAALLADEAEDEAQILVKPPAKEEKAAAPVEKVEAVDLSVGSKTFDAATLGELFETYDKENKKRAEENQHLTPDALDVIELGPVHVEAYHIRNMSELSERIDPQPRRRLARLAELDPNAAADLRVTMRAEERFFAGEHDATGDSNAGRAANVDFRKVGKSLSEAVERAKNSMRSKKVTDDQEVKTGEE